jgi:hypothetical protein
MLTIMETYEFYSIKYKNILMCIRLLSILIPVYLTNFMETVLFVKFMLTMFKIFLYLEGLSKTKSK